jgi:hypothetical protein
MMMWITGWRKAGSRMKSVGDPREPANIVKKPMLSVINKKKNKTKNK